MKKYIKPQIEVSNIELGSIICASDEPGIESTIAPTTTTIKQKEEILSKDFAFDDDWGYEE